MNNNADCDVIPTEGSGTKNYTSNMNKLKEKLQLPKVQLFHEDGSLSTIVRDSFYLAWPAASFPDDKLSEAKKRTLRRSSAVFEDTTDSE